MPLLPLPDAACFEALLPVHSAASRPLRFSSGVLLATELFALLELPLLLVKADGVKACLVSALRTGEKDATCTVNRITD